MQLTPAHLRYLLAVYEISQRKQQISSQSVAALMGVSKPSVARALAQLMERGMLVKAHYGKIYLTDRGVFVVRRVQRQLEIVLAAFPPVELALTGPERRAAALALVSALPERAFVGAYEAMVAPPGQEGS